MIIPPIRKPGEKIYADDHNAVVRFLRRIGGIRGGKGVKVTHTLGGILIELQAQPEYVLPGVIAAVHAPGGTGPQDLSQVTYDVQVKGRPEFDHPSFAGLTPVYGRPDTSVEGLPAKVGDGCRLHFLRRGNDGEVELEVLSEHTAYFECEPPAQAATVTALVAEVAAMRAELAAIKGGAGNA